MNDKIDRSDHKRKKAIVISTIMRKAFIKKLFITIVVLLSTLNLKAQINLGNSLDSGFKCIDSSKLILTNSGNIASAYTLLVNNIKYDVTIDKHRKISSIFIRDKKFSTFDKIRVGASYETIKKNLLQGKAIIEPGWASYFESQSGWGIAFDFRKAIENSSRVVFIFKRSPGILGVSIEDSNAKKLPTE